MRTPSNLDTSNSWDFWYYEIISPCHSQHFNIMCFVHAVNWNRMYLYNSPAYFRNILYKRKLMKLFSVIKCLKLCPYSQSPTLYNNLALRVKQRFPWQRKSMVPEWRHSRMKAKHLDKRDRPSLTKHFLWAFPNSFSQYCAYLSKSALLQYWW